MFPSSFQLNLLQVKDSRMFLSFLSGRLKGFFRSPKFRYISIIDLHKL